MLLPWVFVCFLVALAFEQTAFKWRSLVAGVFVDMGQRRAKCTVLMAADDEGIAVECDQIEVHR